MEFIHTIKFIFENPKSDLFCLKINPMGRGNYGREAWLCRRITVEQIELVYTSYGEE